MNSTIIEHELDSLNFLAKFESDYKIPFIIGLTIVLVVSVLLFRSMKE